MLTELLAELLAELEQETVTRTSNQYLQNNNQKKIYQNKQPNLYWN